MRWPKGGRAVSTAASRSPGKSQVAVRQDQLGAPRQDAQNRDAQRRAGLTQDLAVAGAAGSIEEDARHPHAVAETGIALHQRGGGGAHTLGVDHQHHRPASRGSQASGRAVRFISLGGRTVEQTHDPFRQDELRPLARPADDRPQGLRAHGPGVQVEAGPPARRPMERAVDIVGADLGRADRQAGPAQVAQQRQGDEGLTAARGRGGDDQSASHSIEALPRYH
jgi:hypothetical protein